MAPGVPGGLIDPSTFGTIAGAGMPPSAALSPGIPSSGVWSYMPPQQAGFHPSVAHAGSSGLLGESRAAGVRGAAEATDTGVTAPSTAIPEIAATADLVSRHRTSEVINERIFRSFVPAEHGGSTFADVAPLRPCSQFRTCCGWKLRLR
ncbi:hypothetical protein A5719_14275 [Mycolicibacterium peregrinum]|jgi:hypothetical protein|uniref:Uncharacterized protein n=1 Tax=Mycolicibacterium peregrinum TaxID=43304 RepID=A0A1A1ZCZ9_MYCPR|nr:hypothetical protein A5779_02085 [Mycolicibacterium peregrinum]OBF41428.1 hypothetical protein A5719_14275 [Mycolicibacterium peregrinum]